MPDKTTPHILAAAKAMFADDHDEPWEDGEAFTLEIYINNARSALSTTVEPSEAEVLAAAQAAYENDPVFGDEPWDEQGKSMREPWMHAMRAALIAAARVRLGSQGADL